METAGKQTPMALCIDDAAQQLWVVDRLQSLHSWGSDKGGLTTQDSRNLDRGCGKPFSGCHWQTLKSFVQLSAGHTHKDGARGWRLVEGTRKDRNRLPVGRNAKPLLG